MSHSRYAARVFASLLAICCGVLEGCATETRTPPAGPEVVNNVAVIVAQKTAAPDWLEAVGTVHATQTSPVSSQMMGNLVEIRAREGDRVQSGQVLAIIDDAQPRSGVEQAAAAATAAEKEVSAAESGLALAASTLKRYQQLFDKKSVSPQEFDEIKARYQSAEARRDMALAANARAKAMLEQARTSLGYAEIRAPFAGLVTERKVDVGTLVSPGTAVFTMEDTRIYRLEAAVDESEVRLVRAGVTVPVQIDALGDVALLGKVAQIVPVADPVSRSIVVKIELPSDSRLRSGLFGRAHFSRGARTALLIRRSAVVDRGQLQGVYVIDANQIARLRYVTLGKLTGDQVEVISGLQAEEKLIAAPENRDWDGKRIASQP